MPIRPIALAFTLATLIGGLPSLPAQAREGSASLSATQQLSAKRVVKRVRTQRQVACTVYGCHPIPRGCTPTQGYTWNGIPSGFDVVVCR